MKRLVHFSGLNGLRAIAAISVLFSHTTIGLGSFGLNAYVFGKYADGNPKTTLLAGFGVSIFFSLSGFLITYLLLEEKRMTGIDIGNFYMRRILRIWPLYYFYLAASIITLLLFGIHFEPQSTLYYLLLSPNIPFIFGGAITFLDHYWSLGVEEQFYSFWPWIVKKSNTILRTTIILCLVLILLKCTLKLTLEESPAGVMYWMYEALHVTRFHCMLVGAMGAILFFKKNELYLRMIDNVIVQSISWIVILMIAINKFHIISFLDNEIVSVIGVFLITGQINKRNRIINLETPLFSFVGRISYGIYIIHPLIIFYLSRIISFEGSPTVYHYLLVYFTVFSVTIAIAYVLYEGFEKKFLALKTRYSSIETR